VNSNPSLSKSRLMRIIDPTSQIKCILFAHLIRCNLKWFMKYSVSFFANG
jgi:hypothetical protein